MSILKPLTVDEKKLDTKPAYLPPEKLVYRLCYAKSLQSCPTLSNPMDCSLPGSSIHGIFQAKVPEWGAIAFSIVIVKGLIM